MGTFLSSFQGQWRRYAGIRRGIAIAFMLAGPWACAASPHDTVRLSIKVSPATVWVGEALRIELRAAIRLPPGLPRGNEPLHPDRPPRLEIPYLAANGLPGFDGPDLKPLLAPRLTHHAQQPGIVVAVKAASTPVSEPSPRVRLDRRLRPDQGVRWLEYSLDTAWRPEQAGHYLVGPARFLGPVAADTDARGRVTRWTPVVVTSETIRVNVLPPPDDPFRRRFGAMGADMTVDARLSTHSVQYNDPLSFYLRIGGGIDLNRIHPPRLGSNPELTRLFRIHDETVQSERGDDYVEFRYTLRPRHTGLMEVPGLSLPWLDRTTATVAMATTPPLPLRVLPPSGKEPAHTHGPAPPPRVAGTSDTAAPAVPAPLRDDRDGWRHTVTMQDQPARLLAASGPLIYLISLVLALGTYGLRIGRDRLRRRLATRRFIRRIKRLKDAPPSTPAMMASTGCATVKRFLHAVSGIRMDTQTPTDIWRTLAAQSPPITPTPRCRQALEQCFNACYAPHPDGGPSTPPWIDGLLHDLPALMPARRHGASNPACPITPRRSRIVIALTILVLIGLSGILTAYRPPPAFKDHTMAHLWYEAQNLAKGARNNTDRQAAIDAYRRLRDAGACNAALHYNLGTLHLKNGNHAKAAAALRRAARFRGGRRDIRHNLRLALSGWTSQPVAGETGSADLQGAGPIAGIWWLIPDAWRLRIAAVLFSIFYLLSPAAGHCRIARTLDKTVTLR